MFRDVLGALIMGVWYISSNYLARGECQGRGLRSYLRQRLLEGKSATEFLGRWPQRCLATLGGRRTRRC